MPLRFTAKPFKSDIQTLNYLNKHGSPLIKSFLTPVMVEIKDHNGGYRWGIRRKNLEAQLHHSQLQHQHVEVAPHHHHHTKRFFNTKAVNDFMGSHPLVDRPTSYLDWDFDESKPMGKWVNSLETEEVCALEDYTYTSLAYSVNTFLRGLAHPTDDGGVYYYDEVDKIVDMTDNLDTALEKAELPAPITVYRQISRYHDGQDLLDTFMNDGIYQDNGYVSTTPVKGSFSRSDPGGDIHITIHVPKGQNRGAWVVPFSHAAKENEFLLPRGTRFKILTDMSKIDRSKNPIEIELEMIDSHPEPIVSIVAQRQDSGMIVDG